MSVLRVSYFEALRFTQLILAFKLHAKVSKYLLFNISADPEHSNLDLSKYVTRVRHSLNVFMTYMVKASKAIIRDDGRSTGLLCFGP